MANIQHKSADKTVANIAARNALDPKCPGMSVVVLDASADPLVGGGKALYRWVEPLAEWFLVAKEYVDTMSLASDTKIIAGDKVTATNIPADGLVWDVFVVVDVANNIIAEVDFAVSGDQVTIVPNTPGQYDGKVLKFCYAFGTNEHHILADKADKAYVDSMGARPGAMMMFGGASAPAGWLICDGAVVLRASYPELFAAIGEIHGAGDGVTTFALPDMRGRFAMGGTPGAVGGSSGVTLLVEHMPAHDHDVKLMATSSMGQQMPSSGAVFGKGGAQASIYSPAIAAAPRDITLGGIVESQVGSGQPVPIIPPFAAVNFIIKT